jgi:hypothetical protein
MRWAARLMSRALGGCPANSPSIAGRTPVPWHRHRAETAGHVRPQGREEAELTLTALQDALQRSSGIADLAGIAGSKCRAAKDRRSRAEAVRSLS